MADLPFGFSAGDDPERDKRKKDPDGSGGLAIRRRDPFGFGGSEFDMSELGQIFTRLGRDVQRRRQRDGRRHGSPAR